MSPQSLNTAGMTQEQFNANYWFGSLQMVEVVNPLDVRFLFTVELRQYMIEPGATEKYPGIIANMYLDQMSKHIGQLSPDATGLTLLGDWAFRAQAYNKLIIGVEDLAPQYREPSWQDRAREQTANQTPPWMQKQAPQAPSPVMDAATPPWEQPAAQTSTTPIAAPEPVVPTKPEAGTKSFELNGLTFKAVTDAAGETVFFKNDAEISFADYQKAASVV
jgi:hypothetical protein